MRFLRRENPRTVFREALRRNKYPKPVTPEDKESLEETEERIARQGLPPKSQRLILCRAALGKMGDVTPILKLIKKKHDKPLKLFENNEVLHGPFFTCGILRSELLESCFDELINLTL